MELDDLQQWIEELYFEAKVRKELAEYRAHLLGEIAQPWPFHLAPNSVQKTHEAELLKRKEEEREVSKFTEFGKELQSVEDVLQRARLLHEKETKTSKTRKSAEKFDKCKIPQKDEPKNSKSKVEKKPNFPKNSRNVSEKKKFAGMSLGSANSQKVTKCKTTDSERTSIVARPVNVNVTHPQITKTPQPENEGPNHNNLEGEIDLDFTKVKVDFKQVLSEIELAPKVKKLLAAHTKLMEQSDGFLAEEESREEANFMKNMSRTVDQTSGCDLEHVRTLRALNREIYHYAKICTNLTLILKHQNELEAKLPRPKRNADQQAYFKSETLKLAEEINYHLWQKFKKLSKAKIVNSEDLDLFGSGNLKYSEKLLPGTHLCDSSTLLDDLPYPAMTLTYQSPREVVEWITEKLKHQFMMLEKRVLQNIFESYFLVIDKMVVNEKTDVPSQELVHVLQNAYGLLAQEKILLPAYVIAE